MGVVDDAIKQYAVQQDYYSNAARVAANILDIDLQSRGIRAIVTHRAKKPDSLREKLIARDVLRKYRSADEALGDAIDLAGVRIALYFPGDRLAACDAVERHFQPLETARNFPSGTAPSYTKRFSGYWATHYRVRPHPDLLPDEHRRYSDARIEIQIASVLMHAWSEVEHDLVYKPAQGKLSEEEYAILDELNGLVLAGEIALERLQQAGHVRVATIGRPFANRFDMASFVAKQMAPGLSNAGNSDEVDFGRVDLLYQIAKRTGCDSPERLLGFIQHEDMISDARPIAELIIDRLLLSRPDGYEYLVESLEPAEMFDSHSFDLRTREEALIPFFKLWAALESELVPSLRKTAGWREVPLAHQSAIVALREIDHELTDRLDEIRDFRNHFISSAYVRYSYDCRPFAEKLEQILGFVRATPKGTRDNRS